MLIQGVEPWIFCLQGRRLTTWPNQRRAYISTDYAIKGRQIINRTTRARRENFVTGARHVRAVAMSRPFERFDVPGSAERGVRATRGIPAGAVVLTTEPYAWALRAETRESHCAWSLRPLRLGASASTTRAACGAAFRDEESLARANAVAAFERASAWVLKSSRGAPETSARCALQCLARRAGERDGTCERARYEVLDARGFDGVWALRESRARDGKSARELEKRMEITSAAMVVAALAGEAMVKGATPEDIETKMHHLKVESGVDVQFVISLLSRFEINGFTIADDDMQRVGFGIYPDASLFNHSSTPNAQVMFNGKTLVVKTLREIAVGEEITISYGEQYMPREWTRRRMLSSYGFDEYAAYAKYDVAEAARRRVLDAATRTRLPMQLGVPSRFRRGRVLVRGRTSSRRRSRARPVLAPTRRRRVRGRVCKLWNHAHQRRIARAPKER